MTKRTGKTIDKVRAQVDTTFRGVSNGFVLLTQLREAL